MRNEMAARDILVLIVSMAILYLPDITYSDEGICIENKGKPAMIFCPKGWYYFDDEKKCILLLDTPMTWNKALETCKAAMIHDMEHLRLYKFSVDENKTVAQCFASSLWIDRTYIRKKQDVKFKENECPIIHYPPGKVKKEKCESKYHGVCQLSGPDLCEFENGGCDQLCATTGPRKRVCYCKEDFQLLDNVCSKILVNPASFDEMDGSFIIVSSLLWMLGIGFGILSIKKMLEGDGVTPVSKPEIENNPPESDQPEQKNVEEPGNEKEEGEEPGPMAEEEDVQNEGEM